MKITAVLANGLHGALSAAGRLFATRPGLLWGRPAAGHHVTHAFFAVDMLWRYVYMKLLDQVHGDKAGCAGLLDKQQGAP